ncbi:hypothetical protein TIFTF001_042383 [Ficus carica]|uniref:PGG domain-containing protein n=1 Tax=Ficus carica TaxID=3494 RepID=A0AA88DF27_FICCA|nr:hypothetical protein TIFTF001_042383 [Ficus carica]
MWQENENGPTAGRAIYATHQEAFYVFLISNTLALSSAVFVIVSLTYSLPFRCEIWIATISMLLTYGSAVFAVTPDESVKFHSVCGCCAFYVAAFVGDFQQMQSETFHLTSTHVFTLNSGN